jgi:type VI secretion system secreted protein Hcp
MPIYMEYKVKGSKLIKGDVTADGYTDWIEVDSFQWGVGRGVGSAQGSSGNREASAPSVSEITVTKQQDQGTPYLLEEAFNGTGATVTFAYLRTGSPAVLFMKYILQNVMLSGFSTSSGGDRPTESVSLNFTRIEIDVMAEGATADALAAVPVIYDLGLMKLNP